MNEIKTQTALITGASSGIGEAFARCLAGHGHDLVLTARREDNLRRLQQELIASYQIDVHIIVMDLTEQDATLRIFEAIRVKKLTIDILINNAGFGFHGAYIDQTARDELAMLQVNINSLTGLTRLFVDDMLQRKARGRILNVASTAAFQPGPWMSVYYATKAYVLHYSEALAEELQGHKISVTTVCPGLTKSEFHERAGIKKALLFQSAFYRNSKNVADTGYRAMMRGQSLVIDGWFNYICSCCVKVLPRGLVIKAVAALQKSR